MRTAFKIFLSLGILLAGAGVYFFVQLVSGTASTGEIIVLPIYTGFAAIGAAICLVNALILFLFRRK